MTSVQAPNSHFLGRMNELVLALLVCREPTNFREFIVNASTLESMDYILYVWINPLFYHQQILFIAFVSETIIR